MHKPILVILSGGSSRRFQPSRSTSWYDKAQIMVNGVPLLIRLLENSSDYYSAFYISVNSESRKKVYSELLRRYSPHKKIHFIVDQENIKVRGVCKAIFSLKSLNISPVQILPSDRPYIDSRLFRVLKELLVPENGVTILEFENNMVEPQFALYGSFSFVPKEFSHLTLARADVFLRLSPELRLYNASQLINENKLTINTFLNLNTHVKDLKIHEESNLTSKVVVPNHRVISRKAINFDKNPVTTEEVIDFIRKLIDYEHYYQAFLWTLVFTNKRSKNDYTIQNLGLRALKGECEYWTANLIPLFTLHALQDKLIYFPKDDIAKTKNIISKLKSDLGIISRQVLVSLNKKNSK